MRLRLLFIGLFFLAFGQLGMTQTWTNIATDVTGDGNNSALLDGTALDYYYDATADSLWFRITTSNMSTAGTSPLGFNIMVNYTGGGSTYAWWGLDNGSSYHRLVTGWVTGTAPSSYTGTIGISNSAGVNGSNYTSLNSNNLDITVSSSTQTIIVGMVRDHLIPNSALGTAVSTAAAVGSNTAWNDDIFTAGGTMTIGTGGGGGGTGNHDIGCTAVVSPANGVTIYDDQQFLVTYSRENYGNAIAANHAESILMDLTVNGTLVTTFTRDPANAFLSGAANAETVTGGTAFTAATIGLTAGLNNVCVATRLSTDTNALNDQSCVSVTYADTYFPCDLGISNVVLVTPATTMLDLVDNDQLEEFTITVTNFSASTAPNGLLLPFTFTIDGDIQYANGVLTADLMPGMTTDLTASSANVTMPAFPMDTGSFQLCASVDIPMDADNANNQFCLDMFMENSALNPGAWPVGINELSEAINSVYYNGDRLLVDYSASISSGTMQFIVTNMNGQQVAASSAEKGGGEHDFFIGHLSSGTYVISIRSESLVVGQQKFVVVR